MLTIRERNGAFQAIVRVKREGVIVFDKSRTFPKEALARSWGERLDKEVSGQGGVERYSKKDITLGKLLRMHLEALESAKPLRRARSHELLQLAEAFDGLLVSELRPHDFVQFAQRRQADGTGPATVMHNLATVRAVLGAARALHGVDVDPMVVSDALQVLKRAKLVSRSNSVERRASQEELDALVEEFLRVAAHPSTMIPMHIIVPLAVELPRRRGELTEALWNDLDRDRKVLTLRDTKHPTKVRKETAPLSPRALELIDALPRIDDRILPYKDESISTSFQRACNRLGIVGLRFHDLRHEGITRLFEKGYSIQEVAVVSGHLSWQMLRRYTHLEAENLAKKMHKEP